MSAFPLKADTRSPIDHVRLVPEADIAASLSGPLGLSLAVSLRALVLLMSSSLGLSAFLRDQLLAAVDVVRRASKCRVAHDVNRQRGDVRRSDDAADWQCRPQFVAPLVEVVTEK